MRCGFCCCKGTLPNRTWSRSARVPMPAKKVSGGSPLNHGGMIDQRRRGDTHTHTHTHTHSQRSQPRTDTPTHTHTHTHPTAPQHIAQYYTQHNARQHKTTQRSLIQHTTQWKAALRNTTQHEISHAHRHGECFEIACWLGVAISLMDSFTRIRDRSRRVFLVLVSCGMQHERTMTTSTPAAPWHVNHD